MVELVKLGSEILKGIVMKLGRDKLNLLVMSADGEVIRLYLGPMFAPD
jgi:hypothetical protein